MIKSFRQFLAKAPTAPDVAVFQGLAQGRGLALRRARGGAGCVLEGPLGGQACRIEWGESQRSYISGMELRLMGELALPRELVVMVLNRALMQAMETQAYEQLVNDVQTRVDTSVPTEMRWLVMHGRLPATELGRLRERYGAVSNLQPWVTHWLRSPLSDALVAAADAVPHSQPMVLTVRTGRVLLRTAMPEPDAAALVQWVSVFEHALREAAGLGSQWKTSQMGGPHTQPCAWPLSGPGAVAEQG